MSLFKSAAVVGFFTFISRIFGYIRDIFIAAFMGTGPVADAFVVAFRLPNFFRQLSAEGAFSASFVPLFSAKLKTDGKKNALEFARNVFSYMLIILLILTLVVEICMPLIMYILAPGFVDDENKFNLAVTFARIAFPYLIFISCVSLIAGMLNSVGKFAAAAATPIILNISIITSLILLHDKMPTAGHALFWGIAAAGMLQLAWLLINGHIAGLKLKIKKPSVSKDVKTLVRRMVPAMIGGGIVQFNIVVNTLLATYIAGAASALYYADRFVQFPLAIIGTAMGVALLPTLSKQHKEKLTEKAIHTQNRALEVVLFFTIPAAIALLFISLPIIMVLFERGNFNYASSVASAKALSAYAIGLPAFVMIKIFTPGFFSVGDTKTPVVIAFFCFIANVILGIILMQFLGHVGLALATTISSWVNVILLKKQLNSRKLFYLDQECAQRIKKIVIIAFIMGAIIWWAHIAMLETLLISGLTIRAILLVMLVMIGGGVYFLLSQWCNVFKLKELKSLLKQQ